MIDGPSFAYIRQLLLTQAAIALEEDKQYLIEARLRPLLRNQGLADFPALVARLRLEPPDGPLPKRVIQAMTTNETLFFRDTTPFDALRDTVLPDLLRRRQPGGPLVVWCGACSTGQEPYSVALTILENFPALGKDNVRILASDISSDALLQARDGIYNEMEIQRGLPADLREKYFRREEKTYTLCDRARGMVEFFELNLAAPSWPSLPRLDLVFLRNVLIYFNVDAKKAILHKVHGLLRPDGYLYLGGAESTLFLENLFTRIPDTRAGCFQRAPRPKI
jgi:chemotaxis protein methyltransferase CheR